MSVFGEQSGTTSADVKGPLRPRLAAFELRPYSFLMPDDENTLFYSYWQKARELAAKANNSQGAAQIQQTWADNVRDIGNAHNQLRDIYRKHYLFEPDEVRSERSTTRGSYF